MKFSLSNFYQTTILIVGDIILDRYWYGHTHRFSPEFPTIPIIKMDSMEDRPGGSANIAMNIVSLGAYAHLIGLIGRDDAAQSLIKKLKEMGISCKNITSLVDYPTITKLRIFSKKNPLVRIDFEKHFNKINRISILKRIQSILSKVNVLILSDYAKGTLDNVQEIITIARKFNIPILVDPKGTDFTQYKGATLLTPNISELESVIGHCTNEKELIKHSMTLIYDCKLTALLITRSEKGMVLLQLHKEPIYFLSKAKKVYDVTGAGDTVIAVLGISLAAGNNLEQSCFIANIAASVVVSKFGTSTLNLIELENAIKNYNPSLY